jgi:hypothetical protein
MCPYVVYIKLKKLQRWVKLLIKVTYVPIPIYGIGNGMGFGVTGFSKASI